MSNTNCTLLSQKQLDKLRQGMKNPVFKYLSKGYLQAIVNAIKTSSGTNVDPTAAEVEKMINTSIQENQEQSLNILRDYYKREKQFADRIANMRANGHIEERGSDATNDYLESVTTVQHLRLLDEAFKVIPMHEFITSLPTKDGKKYFSTKVGVLLIDIFGNPVIVNDPNVSEKTIRQQEEAFKAILPSRTVKFATFSNFSDNKEIQWEDSPKDEVPSVEDINSANNDKEETGIDVDDMNKALDSIKASNTETLSETSQADIEASQQEKIYKQVKETNSAIEEDLGGGEEAKTEIQDTVKVAKKGMSFEEALAGQEAFFTKEEQDQIKQGLNGRNLQVMSVSRLTDPAFFSKEIVSFLEQNAKKGLSDPTRVTAIEIWSKHDGLPIKDILDACNKYRVAPMVSFSITGLGGTALEGGVMKYQDMLQKIGELIENGILNAITTTVRIDPILPGVTNMEDIKNIVETAKSFGIKKFVTSLVQSYGYTEGTPKDRKVISGINNALATEGKTYDWNEYYGRDRNGKINFKPKQKYIDEIGKVLLELDKDPEITIQTCSFGIKGLKVSACLDPMIIERITGVDVLRKDGTYDRDTSRPECMCYGCHGDFFKGQNKKCYSSCAYCYAAHSGDNKLNYYNEDGTLKDNIYTRTGRETPKVNQQSTSVNNVKVPKVNIPTNVATLKDEADVNKAVRTLKAAQEGVITPDAMSSEDNTDTPVVLNPIDVEAIQSESRRNEIKRAFTPAIRNEVTTNLAELISNLLFQNIESYKSELQEQQESYRQQNGNDDPSIALMLEDLEDRETCVKTFIESKGIEDILNQARQYLNTKRNACIEFSTKKPENKDAYLQRADLLGNVDKYLEDLLEDASIQLEQMTGLRISVSNQDGVIRTAVNENTATADIDTANQDDNEKGDPNKSEASESIEGLKYRYIDPFALMSREVKMILSSIDMADANIGKDNNWEVDHFVKGILGVERKMPVTQTYAIMLDAFTKYVTKPDDFYYKDEKGEYHFPLLDILKEQHYWARFLENKLRNAVNEDNLEILSKFYTAMRMDFIGYDGIKHDLVKGYQNIKLNQKERASGLLKDAMVSTVNGVRLSVSDVYSYDAETCINNAKKALEINENLFANLRAVSYGEDNSDTRNRAEALVIPLKNAFGKVGLNLSPVLIRSMVISTIGTENNNTPIVRALTKANDIVKRVSQGKSLNKEDKANNKGKISDFRNIVNNQPQDYKWLCREFSEVSSLNNESSFKSADGSKSYQSYSTPNFVGELVNTFTNLDKWVRLATSKSDDYFVDKLFYEIKYENGSERGVAKTVSKNNKLSIEHKVDILIREYLRDKYGNKEWFYKDNEWRNPVLEMFYYNGYKLMSNSNFMNKRELVEIDSTDYNNWTSDLITYSMIEKYCGDAETIHEIIRQDMTIVDNFSMTSFNFPILADSPVCMLSTQEQVCTQYDVNNPDPEVLKRFRNIVKQEIDRIKLVKARKALKAEPITNFDDKGSEFCFFPQLNKLNFFEDYQAMEKTATDKEKNTFIDNVMKDVIAELVAEDRYDASIIKYMTEFKTDEEAHLAMNAMAVNGILARANIIQLTTTDLAFYKNWTDFQKRFKEVYAHGKKLDTNSRFGRKTERAIYLSDRNVVSRQYARIKSIFDHAVKTGKMKSYDRDNFLHKFKEINATDAQSYRSLSSMRAVLDMVGNWNIKMQKAFERFSRGEYSIQDMDVVWNTIKPYMYTVVDTNDGVNNGTIAVPHQNKNSEFLLLTMLDVLNSSAKSPMMKSLNAFMEKNQIDVVTFESAVKAGCQGTIDISHSPKKLESWINANPDTWKTMLKTLSAEMKDAKKFNELSNWDKFCEASFIQLDKGSISQDEYNERMDTMELTEEEMTDILNEAVFTKDSEGNSTFDPNVVHELPYDNYCIQQPTPEHLFDHEVIFGSQFRNLILSDIPNDTEITFKGKKTTMGDLKKLYMNCINANLKESFDEVKKMFQTGPKGMIKLQQKLLSQIKGNPKYGREIEAALELIKDENGNIDFAIPLDNPNTTVALQELLLSVFKNQITKQYIKGATCVLASNIGYTKELNIVYEGDPKNERIKYIECYMPAYSKRFYEPFLKKNSNGSIELDYSKMPEELKMGIGYRIPTESKYSMVPLYIKGFLPQQNGSAIMLPEEITTMAGSDFDIDKLFMMLTEFTARNTYDKKKAWSDFYNANPELNKLINKAQWNSYKESLNQLKETNPEAAEKYDFTKEFKDWFVKSSGLKKHEWVEGTLNKFTEWFKQNKDNYIISTEFKKIEYDSSKTPEQNKREARNNLILDISHAILTHEEVAPLVLRAGNFDGVKEVARIKTILDNYELLTKFAENRGKSLTEDEIASLEAKHLKSEYASLEDEAKANTNLKKAKAEMLATKMLPVFQDILNKHDLKTVDGFLKKSQKQNNPLTLKGFIQNHQQNTAGGKMIGIYANNTTQQAKYQNTGLCLKDDYVFTFNGREIKQLDQIKNVYDEYISHNCAQFSAASVDNAKDPVLQYLLQTTDTANITGFLLRAGFSIEEVFLIFTHPVFQSMYYNGKLNRGAVNEELTKRNKARGLNSVDISDRDFTTDELLKDILLASFHGDTQDYNYRTREIAFLGLLSKILAGAEAINQLTMTSRADSPNGATKPKISMLENQLSRVDQLNYALNDSDFALTGLEHPVSNNTNENYINDSETPMLQGFQTYGLSYIPQVLDTYFLQFAPEVRSRVSEILEQAPRANRDRLLQDFYQQAVEFALTETNMFGTTDSNTLEEKRDYYIYDFPADFLKVVSETPELENSDLLKVLLVKEGVIKFTGNASNEVLLEYLRDQLEEMLYSDNAVVRKLATDLFMYSFYKEGLNYNSTSIGKLFSTSFLTSIPEYIKTVRDAKNKVRDTGFMNKFMAQFYANNFKDACIDFSKVDFKEDNAGNIRIPIKLAVNVNTKGKKDSVSDYYDRMRVGDTMYMLIGVDDKGAIYTPVITFNEKTTGEIKGTLYNAKATVHQISEHKIDEKTIKRNKNTGTQNNEEFGYLDSINEDSFDGIVDPSEEYYDKTSNGVNNFSQEEGFKQLPLTGEQAELLKDMC